MLITDIQSGSTIVIIARTKDTQLEFKTVTGEAIPDKNILLAQVIMQDEKLLTFKGQNVLTDIMVPLEDSNPQKFMNVKISVIKKPDGSVWYAIYTIANSRNFNRREAFRCSVGTPTLIQLVNKHYEGVLKDVSNSGFAFVCDENVPIELGQRVHANLEDYIEKLRESFSFRLSGVVANITPIEQNRIQVGCRLNIDVNGLDKYIVTKERMVSDE